MTEPFRTGFVTLLGRPNVGKSTLLNRLVGQKVSITSPRPQTTRHRILGIRTDAASQVVFVDTPGLHHAQQRVMGQAMHRAAVGSLEGVDLVLLLIGASGWTEGDEFALRQLRNQACPVILVINKIDRVKDKARLLPLLQRSSEKYPFVEIVPVSAQKGDNLDALEHAILRHLPEGAPGFPADQITDRGDRFTAAEFIREQLFRRLQQEIPYSLAVEIQQWQRTPALLRVEAVIWVEKAGQKAIVIGKDGAGLKAIGQRARLEMERRFGCKVYLGLWVKVRAGWADNVTALRALGYLEEQ